jgi:hypothetical protein
MKHTSIRNISKPLKKGYKCQNRRGYPYLRLYGAVDKIPESRTIPNKWENLKCNTLKEYPSIVTMLQGWPTQGNKCITHIQKRLQVYKPGCEADHSPPSSAKVKECMELYLHFPNMPSWHGAQLKNGTGITLPLPYRYIKFS